MRWSLHSRKLHKRCPLRDTAGRVPGCCISIGGGSFVPARVAMELLGHSQIALTLGTYSHVGRELTSDAAQRVGVALWGTPTGAAGN